MNTTVSDFNSTLASYTDNVTLSSLIFTTTTPSATTTVPQPPSYSSDIHDPEYTIMVVLGLSLLLAGLAAFLAVCRPSEQDGDSEARCGESLTCGGNGSSEPQLKVWRRLGSYRRSYNISFRRPPLRRPHWRESLNTARTPTRQAAQPEASVEPHITMPCLFDYVTEI
ncbi:hypothetical protein CesoFtcFv8_020735 [Champsocephalus esox]|uniref:Uncharacterized protein n=1 Tax=Champsocephalus esox TaxID=159716 RepID=A0AAN8BBF7_9TELE|nr:hypothetical protein CesoFtcFv8_020735 [Champsocephalus esox]